MEKLSTYLEELSMRVNSIQDSVIAFKENAKEKKGELLQEVKEQAKAQRKEFCKRVAELDEETQSFWTNVEDRYRKSLKKGKKKFNAIKNEVKTKNAEKYAKLAEQNAEASILFALHSIASAERSVIEAFDARNEVNKLSE